MKRTMLLLFALLAPAGCGDNQGAPLHYTDPERCLSMCLVHQAAASGNRVVLELVVGDQPLTGYSVGFDLPIDSTKVVLGDFTPGTALPAGTGTVAAMATIPTSGPLAGNLVTAQSQKASGDGAVATDTVLPPHAVLYAIELKLAPGATSGVVFDGTAPGFQLPSGGLRNRVGMTMVTPDQVAIGKLDVNRP